MKKLLTSDGFWDGTTVVGCLLGIGIGIESGDYRYSGAWVVVMLWVWLSSRWRKLYRRSVETNERFISLFEDHLERFHPELVPPKAPATTHPEDQPDWGSR